MHVFLECVAINGLTGSQQWPMICEPAPWEHLNFVIPSQHKWPYVRVILYVYIFKAGKLICITICHKHPNDQWADKYIYKSVNKYFALKNSWGADGGPKLELLARNGVHICHAI